MWQTLKRSFSPLKTSTGVSLYPDTNVLNQASASQWYPPNASSPVHLPWYSIVSGFPNNATCIDIDHSLELLAIGTVSGRIIIIGATSRQRAWTLEPGCVIKSVKFIQNRAALIVTSFHRMKNKKFIHAIWLTDSTVLKVASMPIEFSVSCINVESALHTSCTRADFDICLIGTVEGVLRFLVVNHVDKTISLPTNTIRPKYEIALDDQVAEDSAKSKTSLDPIAAVKSTGGSSTISNAELSLKVFSCSGAIVDIAQIPLHPQFYIILQPKGAALLDLRVFLEQNKPGYTPIVWDLRSPLTTYTSECTGIAISHSGTKVFFSTDCGHVLHGSIPEISDEFLPVRCLYTEKYFITHEHDKHPITNIYWVPFSCPPSNLKAISDGLKSNLEEAKDGSIIFNLNDPDQLQRIQTQYSKNLPISKWKKLFKATQKSTNGSMLIVIGGNSAIEPVSWSCIPELDFSTEYDDDTDTEDGGVVSASDSTGSTSDPGSAAGSGSGSPSGITSLSTPRFGNSSIDSPRKPKSSRSRSRLSFMPGKFSKSSITGGSPGTSGIGLPPSTLGSASGSSTGSSSGVQVPAAPSITARSGSSDDISSGIPNPLTDSPPNLKSGPRLSLPLPHGCSHSVSIFWKSMVWPTTQIWPFSIFILSLPKKKPAAKLGASILASKRASWTPVSPTATSKDLSNKPPVPPTPKISSLLCWNFVQTFEEMRKQEQQFSRSQHGITTLPRKNLSSETLTSPQKLNSTFSLVKPRNHFVKPVRFPDFWPSSLDEITFMDSINYFPDSSVFEFFVDSGDSGVTTEATGISFSSWPLQGGTFPTLAGPKPLDWNSAILLPPTASKPKPASALPTSLKPVPKLNLESKKTTGDGSKGTKGTDGSQAKTKKTSPTKSTKPKPVEKHPPKTPIKTDNTTPPKTPTKDPAHRDSVDNILEMLKQSTSSANLVSTSTSTPTTGLSARERKSPITHVSIAGTSSGQLILLNSDGSQFKKCKLADVHDYTRIPPPSGTPMVTPRPQVKKVSTKSKSTAPGQLNLPPNSKEVEPEPLPWWIHFPVNPRIVVSSLCIKNCCNKMLAFSVAVGPRNKYPTVYLLRQLQPKQNTPTPLFLSLPPKGKAKQQTLDIPIEYGDWYLSLIVSIVLPDYSPEGKSPISSLLVDSFLDTLILSTTNGQLVISNQLKLLQFTLSEPITATLLSKTIPSSAHYSLGLIPTLFCGTLGGKVVIYANTDYNEKAKTTPGSSIAPCGVQWENIHTLEPSSPSGILSLFIIDTLAKIPIFSLTNFSSLAKNVPHRFLGVTSRNHFRVYHFPTFERICKAAFPSSMNASYMIQIQNTSKRSTPLHPNPDPKAPRIPKPLFCPLVYVYGRKSSIGYSLFDLQPFPVNAPPLKKTSLFAPFNFTLLSMFLDGTFLAKFSGMWVQGSICHASSANIMPHSPQPIFDLPVVLPNPPPLPGKGQAKTNLLKKTSTRFKSFFRRSVHPGSIHSGGESTPLDSPQDSDSSDSFGGIEKSSASDSTGSSSGQSGGFSGKTPRTARGGASFDSEIGPCLPLATQWKESMMLLKLNVSPQKLVLIQPQASSSVPTESAAATTASLQKLHQKVLERQQKLNSLNEQAEQLQDNAQDFHSDASDLAQMMEKKSKWF